MLVEKKKEFTIRIINILSPLIYEGLSSIYSKAKENSTGDNVLKLFQSFLKRVPKWNNDLLLLEVNRIKSSSKDFEFINDLLRACLKANLYIMVFSPYQKNYSKINQNHYNNIDFNKFIHTIYIECARELWNNPYLFYHIYPNIEIKRNQRDTLKLINNCIEETIRKTLPLKHILDLYLGDDIIEDVPNDDFNSTITEIEVQNLKTLLKKELNEPSYEPSYKLPETIDKKSSEVNSNFLIKEPTIKHQNSQLSNIKEDIVSTENIVSTIVSTPVKQELEMKGGTNNSNTNSTQNVNKKILNILNNKDLDLSDYNKTSENKLKQHNVSETSSDKLNYTNMDMNLKKILKNDLVESETESINNSYKQNNKSYQEIFSNSVNNNLINEDTHKNKFFNNYLQF